MAPVNRQEYCFNVDDFSAESAMYLIDERLIEYSKCLGWVDRHIRTYKENMIVLTRNFESIFSE